MQSIERPDSISNLTAIPQGFAGIVTAVAAWTIWGGEMFPAAKDPTGGKAHLPLPHLLILQTANDEKPHADPSKWEESELRRWLEVVRGFFHS